MTPREAVFLTVGAIAFPVGYHLACRYSGRHFLSIKLEEN